MDVVCLNIAGMMLVRGAMRERELSIRQAIGATRDRLIQHLLAEAVPRRSSRWWRFDRRKITRRGTSIAACCRGVEE